VILWSVLGYLPRFVHCENEMLLGMFLPLFLRRGCNETQCVSLSVDVHWSIGIRQLYSELQWLHRRSCRLVSHLSHFLIANLSVIHDEIYRHLDIKCGPVAPTQGGSSSLYDYVRVHIDEFQISAGP